MSTYVHEIATGSADPQQARVHPGWVLLAVLAAGQLFAFWLLCSHQVRKAEARREEAVVQQMALSDCLQYIPGSTIASCHARTTSMGGPPSRPSAASALAGPVPVSFTLR